MAGEIALNSGNATTNIAINDYINSSSNLNLKNQFDDIFSLLMNNKDNKGNKDNLKLNDSSSMEQKSFSKFDSDFRSKRKESNNRIDDDNKDNEQKGEEIKSSCNDAIAFVNVDVLQINSKLANNQLPATDTINIATRQSNVADAALLNTQNSQLKNNIFAGLNSDVDIEVDVQQLNSMQATDAQLSLDDMAQELNIKTVSYKTLDNVKTDDANAKSSDTLLNNMQSMVDEQNSYITKLKEDYLNKINDNTQKLTMEQVNLTNKLNNALDNSVNVALASLQNVVKNSKLVSSYDLDMGYNVEQSLNSGSNGISSLFSNTTDDIFISSTNNTGTSGVGIGGFTSNSLNGTLSPKNTSNSLLLSQNVEDNAQEIAHKVMQMASRNLKVMELDLDPNNLGRMKIAFNLNDNNEAVSVAIAAANPITKDLLEQSAPRLREILQANNISLDQNIYALDSSFASGGNGFDFEQNQGQNQGQNNFASDQVLYSDTQEQESEQAIETLVQNTSRNYINLEDNSVSYFA